MSPSSAAIHFCKEVAQLKLQRILSYEEGPKGSIHFCKEVAQLKQMHGQLGSRRVLWTIHFCKEVAQLKRYFLVDSLHPATSIHFCKEVAQLKLDCDFQLTMVVGIYPFLQRSGSIETSADSKSGRNPYAIHFCKEVAQLKRLRHDCRHAVAH